MNERSRRMGARILPLGLPLAFLLAACAVPSDDPSQPAGTEAKVAQPSVVHVEDLARDLSLDYSSKGSVIELQRRPDAVIFVRESRNAHVNGELLIMTKPCMFLGSGYALARSDADRVVRTLKRFRRDRGVDEPVDPEPPRVRRASSLPRSWRPRTAARDWRAIVIHHMASGTGSAAAIHRIHRNRGWDGLGYHFVVGNGTLTGNGRIEIGYRWANQGVGAHCKAARYGNRNWWNERAIGICLIGDFTRTPPSREQMDAVVELVRTLMEEYDIPAREVVPHREVKTTACPGERFPWREFQRRLR
ncbi:MAG: peptidoglycan recognition family protein [Planctomycetota bacterium]